MTPLSSPLVSLSVPVCFAEGAYTVLHSVTLQWPAAPPGRMASLLDRSPVILPELSFQKAQPRLCALPTASSGMSANLSLPFFSVNAVALVVLDLSPHLIPV